MVEHVENVIKIFLSDENGDISLKQMTALPSMLVVVCDSFILKLSYTSSIYVVRFLINLCVESHILFITQVVQTF